MARTKHPAAISGHSTKVANKAPTSEFDTQMHGCLFLLIPQNITFTDGHYSDSEAQEKPLKSRRFKPGKLALREIRHFQSTTKLLIPAAPFVRAVSTSNE